MTADQLKQYDLVTIPKLKVKMSNVSISINWIFFAGTKSSSGRRGKAFRTNNSRNRIFPPPPNIPETNFDCANYEFPGLYADTEANCEVSDSDLKTISN